MHYVSRGADAVLHTPDRFVERSQGYRAIVHIGAEVGAVHSCLAIATIEPGGFIEPHVQSHEQSLFVLEGELTLELDGRSFLLAPGDCALVPVGATHFWRNDGCNPVRWIELRTPLPRQAGLPPDTFFVDRIQPVGPPMRPGDPRARNLNHFHVSQMDVDLLRRPPAASTNPGVRVPISSDPLLIFGGTSLKMLIDVKQGAFLGNMFMIQFQPEMRLSAHDHPHEETYFILDGEVTFTADGTDYLLRPGDVAFTGVGCVHSFHSPGDRPSLWLETQSPLPPLLHGVRSVKVWDCLRSS